MKIGIGADHRGYLLKEEIKKYLVEKDIEFVDFGTDSEKNVDYPEIAEKVAIAVKNNECNIAILLCSTGIGMSIVANKYKGIRCALCKDENAAKYAKLHNDANIIALPASDLDISEAVRIIRMFLATEYEGGRHDERLKLIKQIENENMK